jgi:hypothetical protein
MALGNIEYYSFSGANEELTDMVIIGKPKCYHIGEIEESYIL